MAQIAVNVEGRDNASDDIQRVSRRADALGKAGGNVAGQWRDANGRLHDAQGRFAKLGSSAQGANGKLGKLRGVVGGVSKLLGPVGLALSAGAAGAALLQFGKDSITAGSDLQQSLGAAEAIFGKDADSIKRAAGGAADSVGLARSEYLQLASVLGAGLKNQGIKDYGDQTQRVVKLGADLAAQFGGSTQQAVEAIGSLMRGEADPIERYGVTIKQSAINAELAARGQDKLTGAAKTQAEAQARLSLLFEQTATAQGTFAKESSTLAGQQQRLGANVENLKARLGEGLLPIITPIVGAFNELVTGTGRWGAAAQRVGALLQSMFGPAAKVVMEALQGLGRELVAALGGSDKMKAGLAAAVPIIEKIAAAYGTYLAGALKVVIGIITTLVKWHQTTAQMTARATVAVVNFGRRLAGTPTAQRIFTTIWRGLQSVIRYARDGAARLRAVTSAIRSITSGAITGVSGHLRSMASAARSAADFVRRVGRAIGSVGRGVFGAVANSIRSIRDTAWSAISALGSLAAKINNTPLGAVGRAIGGLGRASGGVLLQAPEAAQRIVVNTQVRAPVVVIDGPSLRALVRSELRGMVNTRKVQLA